VNQLNSTARNVSHTQRGVGARRAVARASLILGGLVLALAVAAPGRAQDAGLCPVGGFDICFPNVSAGAPSAACDPADAGAAEVSSCLASICSGKATEPEPGFFSFCCAQGGAVQYDDFCVLVAQTSCPSVATLCAGRCPPLELLTGTLTLAAPPAACLAEYPSFISSVCADDPFCCSTSWDVLCAGAALAASNAL
jgi:hypothetical protein